MEDISIMVVDDHQLFREGLCNLLHGLSFVSEIHQASDGQEFIQKLNSNEQFDIVFMDIAMPRIDGLEASMDALKRHEALKIIALTMHGNTETFDNMMEAGCSGYMLKSSSFDQITNAITTVHKGGSYICSEIKSLLIQQATKIEGDTPTTFTMREMQIIRLIAQGFTSAVIAKKLAITKKTVDKHRENIFVKTNVNNSIELVIYAIKKKVIDMYEIID
nr:response regulator transcription factor [uncultured Carboxylicivirga sp.]